MPETNISSSFAKSKDYFSRFFVGNVSKGEDGAGINMVDHEDGFMLVSKNNTERAVKDMPKAEDKQDAIDMPKEVIIERPWELKDVLKCISNVQDVMRYKNSAIALISTATAFYTMPIIMVNLASALVISSACEYAVYNDVRYTKAAIGVGAVLAGLGIGVPAPHMILPVVLSGSAFVFGGMSALQFIAPVVDLMKGPIGFVASSAAICAISYLLSSNYAREMVQEVVSEALHEQVSAMRENAASCFGGFVDWLVGRRLFDAAHEAADALSNSAANAVVNAASGKQEGVIDYFADMGQKYMDFMLVIPQALMQLMAGSAAPQFAEKLEEQRKTAEQRKLEEDWVVIGNAV